MHQRREEVSCKVERIELLRWLGQCRDGLHDGGDLVEHDPRAVVVGAARTTRGREIEIVEVRRTDLVGDPLGSLEWEHGSWSNVG